MKTLLKYDFIYLRKTSKFIIFPAIAIFFAMLSPATAKYMPEILKALVGSEDLGGLLAPVSVLDSYTQYIGNLYELFLIVIVFVGVSIFMRQKNKGELPLVLSKPISRTKYILSKYLSFMILITVTLLVSGLIFAYYTYILFDTVDFMITFQMTGLFLVYVVFILSIGLFTSMIFNSYAAASISTFVLYIVFSILGAFDSFILDYLPGRISTRIAEVILSIPDEVVWINIIVALGISTLLTYFSILRFKKYDL